MANAKKDLSTKDEASLYEAFDYFCSKMDFEKSFLDSTAISCMNVLFIELKKDTKKYSI